MFIGLFPVLLHLQENVCRRYIEIAQPVPPQVADGAVPPLHGDGGCCLRGRFRAVRAVPLRFRLALPAGEPRGPGSRPRPQLPDEHPVGVYRLQAHPRETETCRVHALCPGGHRGCRHKPVAHVPVGRWPRDKRDGVQDDCRCARAHVELRCAEADPF